MSRPSYRPSKSQLMGKTKKTYPDDWKGKATVLSARDGDKCARCGKGKEQLHKAGYRLVKAHIFSVRTGNNRHTNLRYLCDGGRDGGCHGKDPKHNHLRSSATIAATGYGSMEKKLKNKAKALGLPGTKRPKQTGW